MKQKQSRLAAIPALGLSLISLFASPFILVALDGIGNLAKATSVSADIILCAFYPLIIAAVCLLICFTHPKSLWYTPLVCNAYSLLPAFLDPHFWEISFASSAYWVAVPRMWMFHISFVLSVIAAIAGVLLQQKQCMNNQKSKP